MIWVKRAVLVPSGPKLLPVHHTEMLTCSGSEATGVDDVIEGAWSAITSSSCRNKNNLSFIAIFISIFTFVIVNGQNSIMK